MILEEIEDNFKLHFFKIVPMKSLDHVRNFFFNSKILRSKQTTAKCNQIGNLGFGLGYKSKLIKINETTLNFLAANILFFKKENVVVAQL